MEKLKSWLLLPLLIGAPLWLGASNIKAGERVDINEPVGENLYVAGGEVRINAPVNGDLVAAGGKIQVSDTIMDEGLIAGGELIFDADVLGDLRVAGGKIQVNRSVRGDLVVMGGEVDIAAGAVIGGDLIVFGGKVRLNGTVQGMARAGAGELTLNGVVVGGVNAKGGQITIDGEVRGPAELSAQQISLGDDARFLANVRYWQKAGEIDFGKYLQDGATATFDTSLKSEFQGFDRHKWRQGLLLFSVYRFVAGILLIILLVAAFHRFFTRHAGKATENMAASFGYGVLYFIGVPVLAVLAFITIIGIPVGLILTAGYGISLALAGALVSTVLAYEAEKYLGRDWSRGMIMIVAIGISLVLRFLGAIPMAGGLIMVLLVTVVFGLLYQNISAERKLRRAATKDPDIV